MKQNYSLHLLCKHNSFARPNPKNLFTAVLFSAFAHYGFSQNVGINTTGANPNASAMLDIESSNKGLLIPRIALTSTSDATTIPSPATSLLVYNTTTTGGMTEGFYYNAGTAGTPVWTKFATTSLGNGTAAGNTIYWNGSAWVVNSANIYNNGANVGIGTTTPAYKLTIPSGSTFGYGDGTTTYSSRTESRADAGAMGSAAQSGFFQTSAPAPAANWPAGATSWWHLIDVRHSNDANNYAMQFAGSFFDQNLYFRKTNNAANTAWSRVLTTADNTAFIQNQNAAAQITANFWISGNGYLNGSVGIGGSAVPYKLSITGTGNIFGVDNTASFVAKNAGGTYETYLWPRWSDNIMYMNYGSAGLNLRNNASATAMFVDNALNVGFPSTTGYKVTIGGDLYVNGGWARIYGAQGLYWETYGGGWQMTDGTWLRTYNAKPILATGGVAGYGNGIFGTIFNINPRIYANYDNVGGGGIIISDDGGFADYNDAWITYRGSYGLKVSSNTTGSGSNVMQISMVDMNGANLSDKALLSSNSNYGFVGTSGTYWYRMYAGAFNTASRRELKRNITPVEDEIADMIMADLEKMKPSFYKFNDEKDNWETGKESKFRANMHMGLIVDETPDYLQDDAFMGVDVYSVATMGVFGAKQNHKEIKEIKEAIGYANPTKTIQDFGSASMNGNETTVTFSPEFIAQLQGATPVISITPTSEATFFVTEKTAKGFKVKLLSGTAGANSFDYMALAKVANADVPQKNNEQVDPELMRSLKIDQQTKSTVRHFWEVEVPERNKAGEEKAAQEAIGIQQQRKAEIENGSAPFHAPESGPVKTETPAVQGPRQ